MSQPAVAVDAGVTLVEVLVVLVLVAMLSAGVATGIRPTRESGTAECVARELRRAHLAAITSGDRVLVQLTNRETAAAAVRALPWLVRYDVVQTDATILLSVRSSGLAIAIGSTLPMNVSEPCE